MLQAKSGCRYGVLASLAIALLGTACNQSEAPSGEQPENAVNVSIITFLEQEAGTDPYPVRVLVSPEYVRLDDDYDESDFVLLERRSRTLYSVAHESRSVLVIKNQPFSGSMPPDMTLTEERSIDEDAPTIAGKQPIQVTYLANGTPCYQAISVAGLLDSAVAGMSEFSTVLAERQLGNLDTVPDSIQTPCFLSRYGYAPERHYSHGLPVQVWDESGFNRSLTDYRAGETVAAALFEIPGDYQRLQLEQ